MINNLVNSVFSKIAALTALLCLLTTITASASDLYLSPEIAEARLKGDKFVVTSPKDSGAGSLRQAIADAANASSVGSVITFSSKLNGKTIVLSSGELLIAENAPPLEITAAGLSKGVKIDARQTSRIFNVEASTDVHLQNLTLTGGKTSEGALGGPGFGGSGGAIHTVGTLNLTDCVLTGNATGDGVSANRPGGFGGAISNNDNGFLTLCRCVLTNNTAGNGASPNGAGGRGGAIHNRGTSLTIIDSTIDDNQSGNGVGTGVGGTGGGIYNAGIGSILAQNTTISRNKAGDGGSGAGGGIFTSGNFYLSNCTITENHAGLPNSSGGGIFANADFGSGRVVSLLHCTVAGNEAKGTGEGGGIRNNKSSAALNLDNTIVSNNTASMHSNLDTGNLTSISGVNFLIDTPLSPLGDYGGLTQTMPPIPGVTNIVIFGNGAPDFTPATDQRGVKRIQGPEGTFSGRLGDLGAVEVSTDCQLLPRLMIENGATVFTVTSPKDAGKGTLRQALSDADAAANPDGAVIVFSTKLNGKTITLTSGQLTVNNKVAVLGASLPKKSTEPVDLANGVTISAGQNSRVIQVSDGSNALMRNLTIRDGYSVNDHGGGIFNGGKLTLCDTVVTENETEETSNLAVDDANGGGLYGGSSSETLLIRTRITQNQAGQASVARGGGIALDGDLVCVDSEISGNRTADITSTSTDSGDGGGIYIRSGTARFFNCTISDNHTGAAPFRGLGGGIYASGDIPECTNCTIVDNSAGRGGGIYNGSFDETLLTHCTVVGNSADQDGGGIDKSSFGGLTLKNSIVSDNTAPSDPNIDGPFTDDGGNRTTDGAQLAPLGDYGGPTKTMPPLDGSPVIDQINTIDVQLDQNGAFRNDPAEIGAVDLTSTVINQLARAADPPTPFSPAETDVDAIDPAAAGTFSGILTDPVTGKAVGTMTVKMSASGAITIAVSNNGLGVKTSFKTTLDGDGKTNGVLTVKGVDYNLFLELVRTSGGENKFKFDGEFGRVGDTTFDVSLDRAGFNKKTNPAPMAGKYTSLLPATLDQSAPQGDGYGLVTVGTDGKVKFAGALGDGTKFSVGGFVSEDSEWRLFKDLYRTKPKGNIGGVVTFADLDGVSDFNGSLSWMKMADTREKLYKDGFNIEEQPIIGSLYSTPFPNEAILSPIVTNQTNNASLEFGKGNIDTPDMKLLTWDGRNRVKANGLASGQSLAVKPTTKSGLVRGSYIDKTTKQKISFAGVAFQKQNVISGYFPGNEESGFFAIRPSGGGALLRLIDVRTGNNFNGVNAFFANIGIDGGLGVTEYELKNEGNGNLTILGVDLIGDAYFLTNAPENKILTPGESLFFGLTAAPRSLGEHLTTMTVRSDGGNVAANYRVNGVNGSGNSIVQRTRHQWNGTSTLGFPAEIPSIPVHSYNPFVHGGTYQGFTYQGAGESVTGFVTVKAGTKNGAISGTVVINGVKESFKGTVNFNGTFASTTNRGRNVSFNLFQVTNGSNGFKLIGAFAGDDGGHQFELVRSGFHKTTNPNTDFDGLFTMVLPSADNRGDDAPNGDGYGTASIGIDGRSKAALVLGDGTKATHAGFVSVDGEWMIYKNLYRTKPKGHIAGRLLFRDVANISDFDGELQWVKHADRREKRFNRGFEIRQITLGSVYTPPASGERAFDEATASAGFIDLTFTDGDVPNIPASSFGDWATTNKVVIDTMDPTQKFAVKVNAKNGVVTGTYTDSLRKKKIPFGGVIFEKQDILTGHFIGTDNTGVFGITAPND